MKRLLFLGFLLALTIASIVLAQTSGRGTLRTPSGDHPITWVQQGPHIYLSASDVIAGLGGELVSEATGHRIVLSGVTAAFGADSRYAVVREDLIEMPVPPIMIEGSPYVPWQFFQGFLAKTGDMDVSWNSQSNLLLVRPQGREAVGVQVSVANLQGISKLVLTLSDSIEYTIAGGRGMYAVRFRSPIRAPFSDQAYDDPHVARLQFLGNELRIQLTSPDVVGDAYRLENPARIVLDFRTASPSIQEPAPPALTPARRPETLGIRTIVIDPGHGGKEVGAVGPSGLLEKDVTLTVSRKLAAALTSRLGARVILTRDDDSLLSLDQRTAIANQYNADLFLSVHMNAAVVAGAKGSETYFLSLEASDELARKAAESENASGGSSGTDLSFILWDLAQQTYLGESSRLAQSVQESLNAATGVANRGVKQAPFKVLLGATMPAALVEVGFITNPEEEKRLQTESFQNLMVDAIVQAISRYKTDYETRIGLIKPVAPEETAAAPAPGIASPRAETQ
jgi:N-acetylmuramoyl-L-alanine amidase